MGKLIRKKAASTKAKNIIRILGQKMKINTAVQEELPESLTIDPEQVEEQPLVEHINRDKNIINFDNYIITSQFVHINKSSRAYSGVAGALCIDKNDYKIQTIDKPIENDYLKNLKYTLIVFDNDFSGIPGLIGLPFPGVVGNAVDMLSYINYFNLQKKDESLANMNNIKDVLFLNINSTFRLIKNSIVF